MQIRAHALMACTSVITEAHTKVLKKIHSFLRMHFSVKAHVQKYVKQSHSQTIPHETRPTAEYVLNTLDACAQVYRIHTHPKKDQRRR